MLPVYYSNLKCQSDIDLFTNANASSSNFWIMSIPVIIESKRLQFNFKTTLIQTVICPVDLILSFSLKTIWAMATIFFRIAFNFYMDRLNIRVQSNLYTTATLGTLKLRPLLTSGCCSEVANIIKIEIWPFKWWPL